MQFFLYCICGGIGVSSDYGLYLLLNHYDFDYQISNIAGYSFGTAVSFVLNRTFTFGIKDKVAQRFAMFFGVAATGYCASAILLWVLVEHLLFSPNLSKLLTLPVVVILQFSLNRLVTFRESKSTQLG